MGISGASAGYNDNGGASTKMDAGIAAVVYVTSVVYDDSSDDAVSSNGVVGGRSSDRVDYDAINARALSVGVV